MTKSAKDKNRKALDAEITSTVFDDFEKFEFFFVTYWKQIIYLCVAIVFGVAAVGVFLAWRKATENTAAGVFAEAMKPAAQAGAPDYKIMEAQIMAALKQYPNAPAALGARLRLAQLQVKNGAYEKAFEQYKVLAAAKLPEEVRWRIRLDEAYALELCGKNEQAIAKFSEAAADLFSPEDFRAEANFSAGRIYFQSGDKINAEKFLAKVINAKTGINELRHESGLGFWQDQAKSMRNRINAPAPPPVGKGAGK